MLDGKRYYADFPDEDAELRPRITAVLQALGKVEKVFRKHAEVFRTEEQKAPRRSRPARSAMRVRAAYRRAMAFRCGRMGFQTQT